MSHFDTIHQAFLLAGEQKRAADEAVYGGREAELPALILASENAYGAWLRARKLVEDLLDDDGHCDHCGTPAVVRTCDNCGIAADIIDCGCKSQPRPIAATAAGHMFCDACADAAQRS